MKDQPAQILVCDDDDIFRTFFERVLKMSGFKAVGAANGDEAIEILDARPGEIALVLVDLLMPIRSGWEVIEFMEEHEALKNIPVIAVTGLDPAPDEMKKINRHCAAVVHKGGDFDIEGLIARIRTLINKD